MSYGLPGDDPYYISPEEEARLMMRLDQPIETHCICPPIPIRTFDWCAYRDPESLTGYGRTELEAVADLLEQEDA